MSALAAALAAGIRDRRRAWAALTPIARITTILLALMIAAGVVMRFWNLAALPRLDFDEHHFVPAARRYLLGGIDENDHPPLGKLFIAVGILLLGDNAAGWRAASLILGLQTLVIAAALARELFADRRAGWFAAAFFAGDGFFIAYSRTALLDGGLTCLVLWSMLAAVTAQTWRGVLASAIGVGLAASVKWSGGFVVVPAIAAILFSKRAPRWSVGLFALAPVVHVAIWLVAFEISGRPADLLAVLVQMRDLVKHHIEIGKTFNGLSSPWYSWLVLYRPLPIKLWDYGTLHRYSFSVGNLLLYFSASLVMALACAGGIASLFHARLRAWAHRALAHPSLRAAVLLTTGWFALIAPWIVGRSSGTYFYHYMPPYAFALTLVAGLAAHIEPRYPRLVALYVGAAFALMLFYAPVWAEIPISESVANRRLLFETWRP